MTEDIRYPQQLQHYRSIGRWRPGRLLKRLIDGYEAETYLHLVPRSRKRGAIPPLPISLHGVVLS